MIHGAENLFHTPSRTATPLLRGWKLPCGQHKHISLRVLLFGKTGNINDPKSMNDSEKLQLQFLVLPGYLFSSSLGDSSAVSGLS